MHMYTFLAKITKRSLKMTLLQSISINFAFECIRNIEHSYILKNSSFSLASAEASSHRPPRAFYFSIIAIFIGIHSGSLCGEERFILSCKSFKFCF